MKLNGLPGKKKAADGTCPLPKFASGGANELVKNSCETGTKPE